MPRDPIQVDPDTGYTLDLVIRDAKGNVHLELTGAPLLYWSDATTHGGDPHRHEAVLQWRDRPETEPSYAERGGGPSAPAPGPARGSRKP